MKLPDWASEVVASYESGSAGCFVLHGNVSDRMLIEEPGRTPARASEGGEKDSAEPSAGDVRASLGSLHDFIEQVMVARFDVVLSYDLGFGLKVERGGEEFSKWPSLKETPDLPQEPLPAVRVMTHYLQYCRNLQAMGFAAPKVAILIKQAHLVCPSIPNLLNYELNALAALIRTWAEDDRLQSSGQAAFLISENLHGLHPLIAECARVSLVEVPLPSPEILEKTLRLMQAGCATALSEYTDKLEEVAQRLSGASLSSLESLLLRREYDKTPLRAANLVEMKQALVERDCEGLIEFVQSDRTLDNVIGLSGVKAWLRQDIALWQKGQLDALPMGYLFCGPVGTGKTYLAECLAGEAAVPVVTLQNFRDKWVGSTEANLEKIFALIKALGRCIVFIDEADQTLGQREAASGDSGVSSRVYSMMAQEMSDTRNRGKVIWVLASSRPDLIEVDLKRPGRIDVKIPLFPTLDAQEGFDLIRALLKRMKLDLGKESYAVLKGDIPELLTPGAAEALAVKVNRIQRTSELNVLESLQQCLENYRAPVAGHILREQMQIAADEATDRTLVPDQVRDILGLAES